MHQKNGGYKLKKVFSMRMLFSISLAIFLVVAITVLISVLLSTADNDFPISRGISAGVSGGLGGIAGALIGYLISSYRDGKSRGFVILFGVIGFISAEVISTTVKMGSSEVLDSFLTKNKIINPPSKSINFSQIERMFKDSNVEDSKYYYEGALKDLSALYYKIFKGAWDKGLRGEVLYNDIQRASAALVDVETLRLNDEKLYLFLSFKLRSLENIRRTDNRLCIGTLSFIFKHLPEQNKHAIAKMGFESMLIVLNSEKRNDRLRMPKDEFKHYTNKFLKKLESNFGEAVKIWTGEKSLSKNDFQAYCNVEMGFLSEIIALGHPKASRYYRSMADLMRNKQ